MVEEPEDYRSQPRGDVLHYLLNKHLGAETYVPLKELSYQRWVDVAAHYQPGQRVLVKVLEMDRSDRNKPHVTASVKQAGENPYEKALQRYSVGSRYVGTVSLVDLNGIFVSLDGGIDCLCTHPPRGRPPRSRNRRPNRRRKPGRLPVPLRPMSFWFSPSCCWWSSYWQRCSSQNTSSSPL